MLESNSYLFFVFDSILDQYKTQEICDIVISLYHSLYPDRILPNSKNVWWSYWWFSSSIKTFSRLVRYKQNDKKTLLFLDENFGNVTFCCNEMGFLSVNDNNINLDSNFDEDDSDTVILIKLLAWHSKFKKLKALNALYTIWTQSSIYHMNTEEL